MQIEDFEILNEGERSYGMKIIRYTRLQSLRNPRILLLGSIMNSYCLNVSLKAYKIVLLTKLHIEDFLFVLFDFLNKITL